MLQWDVASRNVWTPGTLYEEPSSVACNGAWCSMPKLRSLTPLVRTTNTATVPLPPKVKDAVYTTPQYRAWRTMVVARAGGRCEAVDQYGHRCTKEQSHYRMYADHIKELKDNGSLLDINNGQCLCASHHELKTMADRYRRLSRPIDGG